MKEVWRPYIFEYDHDGAVWTVHIKATSERDALMRFGALQSGRYVGEVQMAIPVELGIIAKLICWWKNLRRAS